MNKLRTPTLLITLILSVLIVQVDSVAIQDTDPNEPNDIRSSATIVQLPFASDDLFINPSGDQDIFEFVLEDTSQVEILIFADQVGSTLDPIISLFDENETLINQSDDVIDLDPLIRAQLSAGTYFVVVEGFAELSIGFYQIEIFAQSLGDCLESELSSGQTESWNLGEIQAGSRIQVSLMGPGDADFDLALLEVISDSPPVVAAVDVSLSTASQERVIYRVEGDGARPFIAQVSAFAGKGPYMLCSSVLPAPDGSE